MDDRILVIFTDQYLRHAISSILRSAWYTVALLDRVEDIGGEATIAMALQKYSLLITDFENVRSQNMVYFLRYKQRTVKPSIIVVVSQDEYSEAIGDDLIYNAVNHFISVPFHPEEILANAERYLG